MKGKVAFVKENKRSSQLKYYYNTRRIKSMSKTICECGCKVSSGNLLQHQTSVKHQTIMKKIKSLNK